MFGKRGTRCCCGETCLCSSLGCIEVDISGMALDSAWGTNTAVSTAIGYVYNKTHAACGPPNAFSGGPDFELVPGTCADADPDSNSRSGCYLTKNGCSSDGSSFPAIVEGLGSVYAEDVITDPFFPNILQIMHDTSDGYLYVKVMTWVSPLFGSPYIAYGHLWKSTTQIDCSTVNSGSQTLTMSKVCESGFNGLGYGSPLLDDSSATMSVTLYNPSQTGVCLDACEDCAQ